MSEHDTISTNGGGLRAAATRDGRAEAADATTRIIGSPSPAPWCLGSGGLEIRDAATGKRIAYVSVIDSVERARANACVLAAAAEMLVLCREAAVLIAGIPDAYDSDKVMAARLREIVAKAEGRS